MGLGSQRYHQGLRSGVVPSAGRLDCAFAWDGYFKLICSSCGAGAVVAAAVGFTVTIAE